MRDKIVWQPFKLPLETGGEDRVWIKHYSVPFAGLMAASETAFTIPAFILRNGKRVRGFITPADGMAFQQDHGHCHFVEYKNGNL